MLQAFLVLPAFALAYLVAAPASLGRRLLHLLGALAATVVAAGWYLAVVALWPAADRPFIGGSQTNSLWELIFGYNGFGRITGNEVGSVGGGAGRGWGSTGLTRLFGSEMAGGIAWLLPAALLALVAGLWFTRRAPRTDRSRASLLLWGGWLLITALVFSYMGGIIHPYYTVALAPAVGALVGTAAVQLWKLAVPSVRFRPAQRRCGADGGHVVPAAVGIDVAAVAGPDGADRRALGRGGAVLRGAPDPLGCFLGRRVGVGRAAVRLGGVHAGNSGDDPQRRDPVGWPFVRLRRRVRAASAAGWPGGWRLWRRPRRRPGVTAVDHPPGRRADGVASAGRVQVHLDGSNGAVERGSGLPAGERRPGDGGGRLQRAPTRTRRWSSSSSTWRAARSTTSWVKA